MELDEARDIVRRNRPIRDDLEFARGQYAWTLLDAEGERLTDDDRADLEAYGQRLDAYSNNVSPETRAAIAAASRGDNGRPLSRYAAGTSADGTPRLRARQTPAEVRAEAYIRAARGDESFAEGLGIPIRRGDDNGVLVPISARAATVTSGVPQPVDVEMTYPLVRPDSVAVFLGIALDTIPFGHRQYGWLKTAPDAGHSAESADLTPLPVGSTAWNVETLTPSRFHDRRGITLESSATWEGSYAELIQDILANVADLMEKELLTGDGTAPTWSGLMTRAAIGRSLTANSVDDYADILGAIAGRVDGKFASQLADLRFVASPTMHAWLAAQIHAGSGQSALDWINEKTAGLRVSNHMPAITNAHQGELLVRRGMRDGAAHVVAWDHILMIPFPVPGVGNTITGVALADCYIPNQADDKREDFERLRFLTGS